MYRNIRSVVASVAVVAAIMALVLGFHAGGQTVLRVGLYSQLIGAFIGGCLAIVSINYPTHQKADTERWLVNEKLAWTFIGAGCVMWGIGECLWRYFLAQGLNPFPSLADLGYSSFPPLIFVGLILQPSSGIRHGRLLILLDSLISMGAILAITWFLLLGTLSQTPFLADLGKFLSLWYPTSDMALLSCVVFLLIRGQGPVYQTTARRVSLVMLGIGLGVFALSDFIFNIQQNAGTYVDGTWVDLGWPYGIMIIGIAAHLRSFLPSTPSEVLKQRIHRRAEQNSFGPVQSIPYVLLAILFTVLAFNVLSNDPNQRNIRPVLVFATLVVVALVILRQILTQLDNERLTRQQTTALDHLEAANNHAEEQAQRIAERNAVLEKDVAYLKEVHTRLANGHLRTRARLTRLTSSDLIPLASSFNLMAERLIHFEYNEQKLQTISKALEDATIALEQHRMGKHFIVPPSCTKSPEICRLLLAAGFQPAIANLQSMSQPLRNEKLLTNPFSSQSLETKLTNTLPISSRSHKSIDIPTIPLLAHKSIDMPVTPLPEQPSTKLHSSLKKSRLTSIDQDSTNTTDS
jgi:hypothetical protein